MPIDLETECILSLTAAAKLRCFSHRRGGRPINISTLWRWATAGVRGVRLETIMVGGSRCTSFEAVERFCATLTAGVNATAPPVSRQRQQRIKAAEKHLAAAGI